MQARNWRRLGSLGLVIILIGCGGGAQPAAPKPAAPPGAKNDKAAAPAAANAAAAKKKSTKKSSAPTSAFPGEDPANIFVAGSVGEPMETAPAPQFREEDRLQVQLGTPGANSNQLTVTLAVAKTTYPQRPDFKLPAGFTALKEFGYAEDGLPRRIKCDKDDSVMALVSGGGTLIGVDDGPEESGPQWSAFLDAFYMDVTEVTVADFNKFREDQRENKKRVPLPPVNDAAGPSQPALGIPWGEASAYVRWLDKDLPTEVEFEKAARGPDGFRAPWGNGRDVWHSPRTPATIAPVGAFVTDQSVYGIFDLAGNAREWTNDWFTPNAFQEAAALTGQKAARNWTGPKKAAIGGHRVLKGNGPDWSAWRRSSAEMSARLPDVGFRGVLRTPLASPTEASPSTKASSKKAT
jgi:sulfatase modifying factor 1